MPRYTIQELKRRYASALENISGGAAVAHESVDGLLDYIYSYSGKALSDREFETISMILSHMHAIGSPRGRGAGRPRGISAATVTVNPAHGAQEQQTQAIARERHVSLKERAIQDIGYESYSTIGKLLQMYGQKSAATYNGLKVKLEDKEVKGVEKGRDVDRLRPKGHGDAIIIRVADDTDSIKVSVDLANIKYKDENGRLSEGITENELAEIMKGRKLHATLYGTLKADPTYNFTVDPYIEADRVMLSISQGSVQ